jgi:sortase A
LPIGRLGRGSRLPENDPGGAKPFLRTPWFRTALVVLEHGLWAVAILAAAVLGYVYLDQVVHEQRQASRLRELAREAAAPIQFVAARQRDGVVRRVSTRPPPANGEPIGRLEIPGAGISVIVAAGTDALTLRRGAGHIDGTALPGDPGNVGLAGHRDTVFRGLRKLRAADRIFLVTADGSYEYEVESLQTVTPERGDVLDSSSHPTLTLVTCFPFDFVGPAPLRFIVRAREVTGTRTSEVTLGNDSARLR